MSHRQRPTPIEPAREAAAAPPPARWPLASLILAILTLALGFSPALGDDALPGAADAAQVGFTEITPELRQAVDEGLAYLAAQQREDGSFAANRYGRHVGTAAVAGLAFMADGHLPGRGEYGQVVERALEFVLDSASESGLIAADTSHGPMYGHGFATLFLGEIYGQTHDPRVREALLKSVRLIVNTQNDEGGWRYHPIPIDADISVTITQVHALRSARNAGLSVPSETIDRAVAYVKACQNPSDGGFRYMLNAGGSAYPRSAAGVATLFYAGLYEDDAIERGLNYLERTANDGGYRSGGHYFYGQYYAGQAMYLAGGDHWRNWFPRARDALIDNQQGDGRWTSNHGDSYATAMALIVLQMPNRLLPIFQR
ncbi:MAG: prenyltransferase/squalene oxidase repeat-containing protein [Phycisphaeraceae bacterium]